MQEIAEVRRFNRFYTRQLGLLNEHLPACDFTLAEARVAYELATASERTAAELCRKLDMDKGHLSRIAARFKQRGLMQSRVSPHHGKQRLLSLTDAGKTAFAAADLGTCLQIEKMLAPLDAKARRSLVASMRGIEDLLAAPGADAAPIRLRPPAPGDIGWIIHRQGLIYHREYGWDWRYDGLVAEILGAFVANFDAARDDGWIAERDGAIVGSVFLTAGAEPDLGKLRLLYVEPEMRGHGLGRRLVETCIARARQLGYRRLGLWTNSVLAAARHIYREAGFQMLEEAPHHSFGKDLVGQTWVLHLAD
jgi:N-acetylglutamate synthase-like GNAT family acetyltransferase/DNA-binding MarR family transcriptional regulator